MADHLAETGVAIDQLLDLPIDCLDVVLELIDRLLVPFVGQRGLHVFALDSFECITVSHQLLCKLFPCRQKYSDLLESLAIGPPDAELIKVPVGILGNLGAIDRVVLMSCLVKGTLDLGRRLNSDPIALSMQEIA